MNAYLAVADVAAVLEVVPSVIYEKIQAGVFPVTFINHLMHIQREVVDVYAAHRAAGHYAGLTFQRMLHQCHRRRLANIVGFRLERDSPERQFLIGEFTAEM